MACIGDDALVNPGAIATVIFSGIGCTVMGGIVAMVRGGIGDLKNHLSRQDAALLNLSERISRIEGRLNVRP